MWKLTKKYFYALLIYMLSLTTIDERQKRQAKK